MDRRSLCQACLLHIRIIGIVVELKNHSLFQTLVVRRFPNYLFDANISFEHLNKLPIIQQRKEAVSGFNIFCILKLISWFVYLFFQGSPCYYFSG